MSNWIWRDGELVKEDSLGFLSGFGVSDKFISDVMSIEKEIHDNFVAELKDYVKDRLNKALGCNAKIKTKYPKYCKNGVRVCNPQATSFGDVCGNSGCNKVSY